MTEGVSFILSVCFLIRTLKIQAEYIQLFGRRLNILQTILLLVMHSLRYLYWILKIKIIEKVIDESIDTTYARFQDVGVNS